MRKYLAILIGMGVLLAGLQIGQAADVGSVSGKVTFKGTAPAAKKMPTGTDPQVCGTETQSDELVVGADKGIKYAVVRLIGVKGGAAELKPQPVEQKGCKFNPHIVVVPKGAEFDILNSDGISHNIHTHSTANPEINKAQPGFKKKMAQKFDNAEVVRLSCDIHSWMAGWLVVADDAYVAVTDESGSFKLPNVPPGSYKLEVWHEKLGTQTKDVTVKAGDSSVTFEMGS